MSFVMHKNAQKVWYRVMNIPGVEFQFQGRNSDKTHKLAVRSTTDATLVAYYDIVDPSASKEMYLRAAEGKFINEITERAKRIREQRRKQPIPDLRPEAGDQIQKGPVGEQQGAPEGGVVENHEASESVDAESSRKGRKGSKRSNTQG